jgi:hypothetical protein
MKLPMAKSYFIAGVIFLIIGIIGIVLTLLTSSPPWLLNTSLLMGILGMIGSWVTFFSGATSRQLDDFRGEMSAFREEMRAFRKEVVTILKDIRDSLRGRS